MREDRLIALPAVLDGPRGDGVMAPPVALLGV